jgi:hypothetical protein
MQQPARLLWQHFGNCGELQDVLGAASRAALLPVWLVSSMADDHVWNEFMAWDSYYPYQVDWSDGPTRIGNWGVAADDDTGGGKTVSGMIGWGSDGWLHDVLGRAPEETDEEGLLTNDYTRYGTLSIRVVDAEGHPVDGALVVVSTNNFYNPIQTSPAIWTFTDHTGVATALVGEENNYWYRVRSDFGHHPQPSDTDDDPFDLDDRLNQPIVREADMLPGAFIQEEVQLDDQIGAAEPHEIDPPEVRNEGGVLVNISLVADVALLAAQSPYQRWTFSHAYGPGLVDLYVVDRENLEAFRGGEAFQAIMVVEEAEFGEHQLEIPVGDDYFVVVSNAHRVATTEVVDVEVSLTSLHPAGTPDAGLDGDLDGYDVGGGGCDCTTVGRAGAVGIIRRVLNM